VGSSESRASVFRSFGLLAFVCFHGSKYLMAAFFGVLLAAAGLVVAGYLVFLRFGRVLGMYTQKFSIF
jgi:hypothetical protein